MLDIETPPKKFIIVVHILSVFLPTGITTLLIAISLGDFSSSQLARDFQGALGFAGLFFLYYLLAGGMEWKTQKLSLLRMALFWLFSYFIFGLILYGIWYSIRYLAAIIYKIPITMARGRLLRRKSSNRYAVIEAKFLASKPRSINGYPQISSRSRSIIALIAVGFVVLAIAASINSSNYAKRQAPFQSFAMDACLGTGRTDATPYVEGSSFHPIITLDENGDVDDFWTRYTENWQTASEDWESAQPTELQLVACIEDRKTKIDVCSYTGGVGITLWRRSVYIQIYSIQSGELIVEDEIFGSTPYCPASTTMGGSKTGGFVSSKNVLDFIAQYVNPPDIK